MAACGALAGLADNKNVFGEPALRIWNYNLGRAYTAEDFQKAGAWLYHLNAVSVAKQYDDPEPDRDPETYDAEFTAARRRASRIYSVERKDLPSLVYDLNHFFRSIFYQIEDPECEAKAKGFLYRVSFELSGILAKKAGHESECWGEFELA